jgi:hypothetical protein
MNAPLTINFPESIRLTNRSASRYITPAGGEKFIYSFLLPEGTRNEFSSAATGASSPTVKCLWNGVVGQRHLTILISVNTGTQKPMTELPQCTVIAKGKAVIVANISLQHIIHVTTYFSNFGCRTAFISGGGESSL